MGIEVDDLGSSVHWSFNLERRKVSRKCGGDLKGGHTRSSVFSVISDTRSYMDIALNMGGNLIL